MIKNLSVYSQWKKSTLVRVTAKYRRAWMRVFESHLKELAPKFLEALQSGDDPSIDVRSIIAELERVMEQHQDDTVKVGVSDGIREVHPVTKLSTWQNFPINVAIENTFTSVVELKLRNSFSQRIAKKIRAENKKLLSDLLGLEVKRYLGFVRTTFRSLVEDYFKNEHTDDTKALIKNAITKIYNRTDTSAEMMFRTETTRYFNDARVDYFKENTDVDFVQLIAVTDGRISNICNCRDLYVVPIAKAGLRKFKPPFHPNCRTIQSPLDTDLTGDAAEVKRNLGREFGKIKSKTSGKEFTGSRAVPPVPLPRGWG